MEDRIVVYERWDRGMRDSCRRKVKVDGDEKGVVKTKTRGYHDIFE